ncbi:bifunctional biotin--[acetyl-CoA-carboxylase] ligase/biotin operon repressor BirA [Endozoicomonas sp. Mp262]|uniref:bifunctional biotin--[acetyl-CoA-carboxylase] ligase/biotin operon repressor BirA n=1 Tax=Endozoicomonas sp. Mp262 TaxID=2919499 RepID=UPI0021D88E2A
MENLLKLLSDREFHSGEEMGEVLGVSRAAIWKKIKGLEGKGLLLESVRGKGYRLAEGIELLNEQAIYQALEKDIQKNIALHCCLETNSTNDLVRAFAKAAPGKKLHFCAAEHQTAGRGRRGRKWSTPFGGSICLSLLWQVGDGMASLEGLSLAVGLAVVKALESCGAKGLGLKWPNDVLWQRKKLCGILLEVHGDPTGDCEVTIGIGVNVKLNEQQLACISQPAIDLNTICKGHVSRNHVMAQLINTLGHMLKAYQEGGFSLFHEQWNHYDVFMGQRVTLDAAGRRVDGCSLGVNEQGGLLLDTDAGVVVFHGGEVSLRPARGRV